MEQIIINQNDNQNININSNEPQLLRINNVNIQDLNIKQNNNQDLNIKQNDNQLILINKGGYAIGINDVLVNGVSVVSDNIAYIIVPTKLSELQNDMHFISTENDPTIPNYIKQISLADINNWNNKQNELVSGSTIKTVNDISLLGSGNIEITGTQYSAGTGIEIDNNVISNEITSYNDLDDLPDIPTKTSDLLNDNDFVSENDLSEVAFTGSYASLSDTPNIPAFTSDLTNDSGFIDKNVNDLTYYTPTANLGAVALSNDYTDLDNKPTIPTVNDGTLTIQQNGTNVETFTANSSTNKTANITVPTKTSDLNNDSGFITKSVNDLTYYPLSSSLSTVATSGSYNDLSNKPTIPTLPTLINHTNSMTRNTTYVSSAGYVSCYSYGNICMVSINFQLANNIPGGSTLYSGLPTCQASRFMFSASLANGSGIRLYIEGDKICNDGTIGTGGWIDGLAVYPI